MKNFYQYVLFIFFIFSCQDSNPDLERKKTIQISVDSSSLKIQQNYIKKYVKVNQFDSVYSYSSQLESLSQAKKNPYYFAESQFYKGIYHYVNINNDTAYYYFNRARKSFLEFSDSAGIVKTMRGMALIQTQVGDFIGARKTANAILDFIPRKAFTKRADIYSILGYTATIQKDYEDAIRWYQESISDSIQSEDRYGIMNNLVYNYTKLGEKNPENYQKARAVLNQMEEELYKLVREKQYTSYLDNRAYLDFKENPRKANSDMFYQALRIRKNTKDIRGLLGSYSSLTEFYEHRNNSKAIQYADSLLSVATQLKDHRNRLEALQYLIKYDQSSKVKEYAIAYKNLRDSLDNVRDHHIAEFATIRFEINEKRKENAQLQKEILTHDAALKWNQNIIILLLLFGLLSIFLLLNYVRSIRIQNKKKLIVEIQNAEQKLARKVHDELANSLYQTISFIDGNQIIQNQENKEKLIDKIDKIYKLSKDISRESQAINTDENYANEIFSLVSYYKNESTNIIFVGFEEDAWKEYSSDVKLHFYKILQELLTNMRKHSQASLVSLRFNFQEYSMIFNYSDNGIGIHDKQPQNANGMINIQKRLEIIKGKGQTIPSEKGFKYELEIGK